MGRATNPGPLWEPDYQSYQDGGLSSPAYPTRRIPAYNAQRRPVGGGGGGRRWRGRGRKQGEGDSTITPTNRQRAVWKTLLDPPLVPKIFPFNQIRTQISTILVNPRYRLIMELRLSGQSAT